MIMFSPDPDDILVRTDVHHAVAGYFAAIANPSPVVRALAESGEMDERFFSEPVLLEDVA